jgi:Flp pilus assembly protein TadG
MVEYALTAILFFTLLIFVMDGGRILWHYVSVAEAARVGARYGITHGAGSLAPVGPGNYEALRQVVLDQVAGLDPANLTVTATWSPDNRAGSTITVEVAYTTQPLTGLFWRGQTITLRARSRMIIQN